MKLKQQLEELGKEVDKDTRSRAVREASTMTMMTEAIHDVCTACSGQLLTTSKGGARHGLQYDTSPAGATGGLELVSHPGGATGGLELDSHPRGATPGFSSDSSDDLMELEASLMTVCINVNIVINIVRLYGIRGKTNLSSSVLPLDHDPVICSPVSYP